MPSQKPNKVTIDATGKPLGRIAAEIAINLQGKCERGYQPNRAGQTVVVVQHADAIKLTGNKLVQKEYIHATGYPGGLRRTPVKKLLKERPNEVVRRAVWNMLPKNKLRTKRIKRLLFENT